MEVGKCFEKISDDSDDILESGQLLLKEMLNGSYEWKKIFSNIYNNNYYSIIIVYVGTKLRILPVLIVKYSEVRHLPE